MQLCRIFHSADAAAQSLALCWCSCAESCTLLVQFCIVLPSAKCSCLECSLTPAGAAMQICLLYRCGCADSCPLELQLCGFCTLQVVLWRVCTLLVYSCLEGSPHCRCSCADLITLQVLQVQLCRFLPSSVASLQSLRSSGDDVESYALQMCSRVESCHLQVLLCRALPS